MLRVSLEQWRMFLAVVEHGGFNQAAKHIHKSQSSIHHAVTKIESSLGAKLFKVHGRRLKLTEQGRTLFRRAQYLVSEASKIEQVAVTMADGVEPEIRIAVDAIFPHHSLYDVLESVSAEYPNVRVELVETVLSGALELLQEGVVDLAIGGKTLSTGWNQMLMDVPFLPVTAPQHPLQNLRRALKLEDLKAHRQIVIRDSARNINIDDGWLEAEQRWTVSHLSTSIRLIRSGHGFAWLPLTHIDDLLERKLLKPLPLGESLHRKAALYLSCLDHDALGPASQLFAQQLVERCHNHDLTTDKLQALPV